MKRLWTSWGPELTGAVCGIGLIGLIVFCVRAENHIRGDVAPPSSEWKQAPPVPIEMNLFGEPFNPTNTPVVIDKKFNIYVYGKWVADTNGLRP